MFKRRRTLDGALELLRDTSLFRGCTDPELFRIQSLVDLISAEAGRVLVRENTVGREVFVIVDGEAAVTRAGRRLALLRAGDPFGEVSVLTGDLRTATVTAVSPMRLLVMDARSFFSLIAESRVAAALLRILSQRFGRSIEWEEAESQ